MAGEKSLCSFGARKILAYGAMVTLVVIALCPSAFAQWQPAKGPLMTRWAKDVSPDKVHAEYPRPQMVRKDWLNLNGLWDYAIRPKDESQPQKFDGQILVPFPVESALSGVMKQVGEPNRLWYRRAFEIPNKWTGKRVLLHFGAVDWEARVWVNGKPVGMWHGWGQVFDFPPAPPLIEPGVHRGGYDSFTFDITDALNDTGIQQIVVSVWDPTDAGTQARGKQVRNPHKIWYTPTTGIWQTVWLEPVPATHIQTIGILPDTDNKEVRVGVGISGIGPRGRMPEKFTIVAKVLKGQKEIATAKEVERPLRLKIEQPKLWSADSPYLYDLCIELWQEDRLLDTVTSYFGMRKVSLGKDKDGITRILLNDKPLFQYGPLDQGFWPDGIYTAPTDEALRYDIEMLKKLGCNMMRKHVKIEPERFYYWCDKLGMLVWQDMPNGDKHISRKDADITRAEESAKQFELELMRLVHSHWNHPSIIMWVVFNEGWGQFDTERFVSNIKNDDRTRLVNNASGWADRGVGDVNDIHKYPGPAAPKNEANRAAVLGEFGGLGLPIKGHTWQDEANWGYRKFETQQALTDAYLDLLDKLRPLIAGGLSAAVYTQTTDVEIEVNGLLTYDRELVKMDAEKITAANKSLYGLVP